MRKVVRTKEPEILKENKTRWTNELLEHINSKDGYSNVTKTYKERFRNDPVKNALEQMYSGLCCYCESSIGISDYEHIEHLRPKSIFPELSFEWDNLHWSCAKCNIHKGEKWNEENPILDPTIDNPEEHLAFNFDFIVDKSERGRTTIDHADLNRKKLRDERLKILAETMRWIEEIRDSNDSNQKARLRDRLTELSSDGEPYCSFVQHLITRYLDTDWKAR